MYFCRLISSRLYWIYIDCSSVNESTQSIVFCVFTLLFFWQYSNDCKCRNWLMRCTKSLYCWRIDCVLWVSECVCPCPTRFSAAEKKCVYSMLLNCGQAYVSYSNNRERNWLCWVLGVTFEIAFACEHRFYRIWSAALWIEFHLAHTNTQDIHAPLVQLDHDDGCTAPYWIDCQNVLDLFRTQFGTQWNNTPQWKVIFHIPHFHTNQRPRDTLYKDKDTENFIIETSIMW